MSKLGMGVISPCSLIESRVDNLVTAETPAGFIMEDNLLTGRPPALTIIEAEERPVVSEGDVPQPPDEHSVRDHVGGHTPSTLPPSPSVKTTFSTES